MAKKFTASDIEKMQKENEQTVKNQVIPSLNKVSGGSLANGKVSSYQPSDVKQQRTIINTNEPIIKSMPQQIKTTSNTMTIGGKTFNVSSNANSNAKLDSANGKNIVTPERQLKNNTREYAYGSQNGRTALASLVTSAMYKPLQSLEGAANLGKSYTQSVKNKITGKNENADNLDFRLLEKRNNLNEGGRDGVGQNKGFDAKSLAKSALLSSLGGGVGLANGVGNNLGKQLADNPQTMYDIGQNLAEMATVYGLGNLIAGPMGAATLGGFSQYDEALKSSLDRGNDINTATKYATVSADIEGLMAAMGLNSVEDMIAKEGASAGRKLLGSAVSEGAEEGVQYVLDKVNDNIVNRKDTTEDYLMYQQALANGMSEKEAKAYVVKQNLYQLGMSTGAGALFGGAFGGAKLLGGNSNIPQLEQNTDTNSQWLTDAQTQKLLDEAAKTKDYPQPIQDMIDKTRRENPLLLANADDQTVYDFIQNRNEKMTSDELANQNYNNLYNVMNNTDAETVAPTDNGIDAGNAIDLLAQGDAADAIAEFRHNNPLISQGMSNADVLTYIKGIAQAKTKGLNSDVQTNSMLDYINNNTNENTTLPATNYNVPENSLDLLNEQINGNNISEPNKSTSTNNNQTIKLNETDIVERNNAISMVENHRNNAAVIDQNKLDGIEHAINKYYETGKLFNLVAAERLADKMQPSESKSAIKAELGDLITVQTDRPNSPYAMAPATDIYGNPSGTKYGNYQNSEIPSLNNDTSMSIEENGNDLSDWVLTDEEVNNLLTGMTEDETEIFSQASANPVKKSKAKVNLKSKNISSDIMSTFKTAAKDIEFDNNADAQQFGSLLTELKDATETLYSPDNKTRADVAGALMNIQNAYIKMSNFLKEKGTITKASDNGKRQAVDNFYELTKNNKLLITPELKRDANLDKTSIFDLNNMVNFTNRKNDRLMFTTDAKNGTTIEDFVKQNPEVMNVIGAEEGEPFSNVLNKLIKYTEKLRGEKDSTETFKADAEDVFDWNIINNDANAIVQRLNKAAEIPSISDYQSMAVQNEINNGTMGIDAEGNLEAYENTGLDHRYDRLPQVGEPYFSAMDIAEGRTTPTGGRAATTLDNSPVVSDTQTNANGDISVNTRFSDVATNTGVNNDFYTREQIEKNPDVRAVSEYIPEGEATSLNEAIDRVINNAQQWENDYVNGKVEINSNKDVDTAMLLLTEINEQLKVAQYGKDTNAIKALEARKLKLFSKLREAGTQYGRTIQAFAKWNRTADGAMLAADTIIDNTGSKWAKHNTRKAENNKRISNKLLSALNKLVDDGTMKVDTNYTLDEIKDQVRNTLDREYGSVAKRFSDSDMDYLANLIDQGAKVDELADALNRKFATGTFGISSEAQQKVNDLFEQAKQYGENSRDRVELETEAYKVLAEELVGTGSWVDKFNTWRYLAMLGNPKTHIRNMIGNIIFRGMTSTSDTLAAAMEATIDNTSKAFGGQGIERTKSILNPLSGNDRALISAASKDAVDNNYRALAGQKYSDGVKSQIEQQINPFKSKFMRWINDLNSNALEAEDFAAVRSKYATSLAGYLKANGADVSIFADPNNELLVKAREYATKQAEYSAFHEDSKLATFLSQASSKLRNVDSDNTFENIAAHTASNMIEGLVPFKKTPMNVLRSGVEYSPLNTVQDLNKLYKVLRGKDGVKAADYLESVTKTMTGSAIFALGAALYDKGLLQTKDEETQYQDQLEGKQNYSIKIGNKTYTIDNFAPFVMPLFAGAETKKAWDNRNGSVEKFWNMITSGDFDADALLNATGEIANGAASVMNGIASPIVETSMLQGVQNTMEDVGRAAQEDDTLGVLGTLVTDPLISYGTQVVPTLSGQVARTVDNTRRSTYTDKTGFAGSLERQGKKMMNKIPGLSKYNEPYVDTYGRTENNSPYDNVIGNAAYQFLSPSYIDDVSLTRADQSARELFEKTGDASVFADRKTSKRIDGQRVSPEDYTKYSQASGSANNSIREYISKNANFRRLSTEQQKEILANVDTVSDKVGESKINSKFKSDDNVYEAYLEGGEKGVSDYLIDKALLNNGASVYKDKNGKSKTFSSCSLQEQSEIVNKLVSQHKMTKEQATKYMKDTDKFIIQNGNTKETLENKYGAQGSQLYFDLTQNALNDKGSMTTQTVLPYLESKGVSEELAGDVLYSLTNNSDKVETINSEMGSSGVYQYYKYKTYADYDGNGSLKKDEITSYLNSLGLTQDQKRYWFGKLASARTKNPY